MGREAEAEKSAQHTELTKLTQEVGMWLPLIINEGGKENELL